MAIDSRTHTQINTQLYALTCRLNAIDDCDAELRDNTIVVSGPRGTDTITCAPRQTADGQLWFFDSARRPIIEADNVTDAAVHVMAVLR